jgi:enterochelin esterase-like enzyme
VRLRLIAALVVVIGVFAYLSGTTTAPPADKAGRSLVPAIESGRLAVPVVTPDEVVFYAQGEAGATPRVVSDLTGWGERADGTFDFTVGRMHQIAGTNWFTLRAPSKPSARIEYLLAYGAGDYRLDPRNPRRTTRVGGDASEIVGRDYVPPPEFTDPAVVPSGRITETMVPGAVVNERRVIVYTPPGYDVSRKYRLAVFHDGALVVNTGEAPRVIDWLIAHDQIEPIVAVFVDPKSRADDFRRDAPMRDFVATELMAWINSHYSVTPVAADHAIIGISAGARGALDVMAAYPGVFAKSGLMIPAVDSSDVLKIPVKRAELAPLEACVIAATYDHLYRGAAELVRDSMKARGHTVRYIQVDEGHSTMTWKTHLRDVLTSLFGR